MTRHSIPDVVLGFDFGTRRIGVAVGNGITGRARALKTVAHAEAWRDLDHVVAEWRPQALVVGLPLRADGSNQPITDRARAFMDELATRFGLPVHEMDERFSTIEAAERLRAARASGSHKKRLTRGDADAMAAQIILESWFTTAGQDA